jgi:amyloid beta precursor protein binding protein 1
MQENCNQQARILNRLSEDTKAVLSDARALNPRKGDDIFWFLAHGVREYKMRYGRMPQTCAVKDVHTTTNFFMELKKLYTQAAQEAADEVLHIAKRTLQLTERPIPENLPQLCTQFCANCWDLCAVKYNPVAEEWGRMKKPTVMCGDGRALVIYHLFRAAKLFAQTHGHYPGYEHPDADACALKECLALSKGTDSGVPIDPFEEKYFAELLRYGGAEVNTTSSIVGGIASAEIVKLVQQRRVPVRDIVVYDGLTCSISTLHL